QIAEELLRIAQEAVNNANRHADSKEIRIELEYQRDSIELSVMDDGKGFDLAEGLGKSGHWGLKNMRERAGQIGGSCNVSTAPGRGTRIHVQAPLNSSVFGRFRARSAASGPGAAD